jgi:hypothetical protein
MANSDEGFLTKISHTIINFILNFIIDPINTYKTPIYLIYFIIYFFLFYLTTLMGSFADPKNNILYDISKSINESKVSTGILIFFDVICGLFVIGVFVCSFLTIDFFEKNKVIFLLSSIFIIAFILFFNIIAFGYKLVFPILPVLQHIILAYRIISITFYIIFTLLFAYNMYKNINPNIEFYISLEILLIFTIQNILLSISNIYKMYASLRRDDFSTLTIKCYRGISERFNNNSSNSNIQLNNISAKYGSTYLKTRGNIPIAFFNKNINQYQDLILADFYYPGSYYSYLSTSPLNGRPSLDALKISIVDYKCRIIHLDIYSDSNDEFDPNANPIIKCEKMSADGVPLKFDEVLNVINKYAWVNNDRSNISYPFFLYLNFKFNIMNQSLCIKVYNSLLKVFSKYLMPKKYSFSERNTTFPVARAPIAECIGKIIIISNIYPTKTALDELINTCTNELNNTFKINLYKDSYVQYDKVGISIDSDKTKLLNDSKTNLSFYYTIPNDKYKNNEQAKAGLYNPSFQDIAQYGIQGTLMYLFVSDDNFNNWITFFLKKNDLNPVLKDELLRYVINEEPTVDSLKPIEGLQPPQKYCLVPRLMSTDKSNVTEGNANNTCKT